MAISHTREYVRHVARPACVRLFDVKNISANYVFELAAFAQTVLINGKFTRARERNLEILVAISCVFSTSTITV